MTEVNYIKKSFWLLQSLPKFNFFFHYDFWMAMGVVRWSKDFFNKIAYFNFLIFFSIWTLSTINYIVYWSLMNCWIALYCYKIFFYVRGFRLNSVEVLMRWGPDIWRYPTLDEKKTFSPWACGQQCSSLDLHSLNANVTIY